MTARRVPAGLPLVGDLPAYLSDRLAYFAARGNGSGPIVRCRLAGDGYLLNEPEDIRHVLVRNEANYVKSRRVTGPRAEYPSPRSLLTSTGADHRRRRLALQGIFRRPLVERLVDTARANAGRLAESWRDGAEVDVGEAMTALAQRNILETLLGSASEEQLDRLAAATAARRRAFERHFVSVFPLLEYVPLRLNRDHLRVTRRLHAAIGSEIDARRAGAERPADLLSMLMDATFDDGATMSDRELRQEVLTFSLTGYDSVSEALTWTLYLLAQNPEVDAALAREALGASPSPQLPYATSVVRESLRLFPPTWIFVRIALGDDELPSGARIAARAKVYLCPYVVHRDPRHWPEPARFLPDRFADGAANGRPRYAYFPFGGGTHVCIGESLAMAQIVTVLATLAARHRLTLTPNREVLPEGGLSLRPKEPLRMRVEPRAPF